MRDQIHIEGTLPINWPYTHILNNKLDIYTYLNISIPFLRSQYMRDQIHIEGTLTINWTYTHILNNSLSSISIYA